MKKKHNKYNGQQYTYITAVIFSISATLIALVAHALLDTYPAVEVGALAVIFFSAFLISHRLHQILQKTNQPEALNKAPSLPIKEQPVTSNKVTTDRKPEEIRAIFITSDTSDRHQIHTHLTNWQMQVKACSNSVRTFTEILSAADHNTPYNVVIVDQLQLDMEPVQFANSIYSEPALQNLSLIYLGPENTTDRNQQLIAAGYSHILQNPIDKSLLYNALHATINTEHHYSSQNVTSFINHYTREQSSVLPPLNILVAANPVNLKRIKHILKTTNHQVFSVENGEHALNALDNHNFDVAIFELEMPIMNGAEAIKLYRFTHQNNPWTPFILFAPEPNSQIINECNELDVDVCLAGKIQHHTLLAAIKQAVTEQDKEHQPTTSGNSVIAEDFDPNSSTILGQATLRNLEELGSGREFVHNLINSFLLNSEELLRGMEKAITEDRYQSFIDHAFAFKDGAGNLGALAVYKASIKASRLEYADFKDNADTLLNEIQTSFNKTRRALLDYMAEQNNTMHGH